MSESDRKRATVGELNGVFSLLFRFLLILAPVFTATGLPWAVWVTTEVFEAKAHIKSDSMTTVELRRFIVATVTESFTDISQSRGAYALDRENLMEHMDELVSTVNDMQDRLIRMEERLNRMQVEEESAYRRMNREDYDVMRAKGE